MVEGGEKWREGGGVYILGRNQQKSAEAQGCAGCASCAGRCMGVVSAAGHAWIGPAVWEWSLAERPKGEGKQKMLGGGGGEGFALMWVYLILCVRSRFVVWVDRGVSPDGVEKEIVSPHVCAADAACSIFACRFLAVPRLRNQHEWEQMVIEGKKWMAFTNWEDYTKLQFQNSFTFFSVFCFRIVFCSFPARACTMAEWHSNGNAAPLHGHHQLDPRTAQFMRCFYFKPIC